MIDPSSHQRGRPTSTKQQLSDINKNQVMGHRWGLTPRLIGRLIASRNVTSTLTSPVFNGLCSLLYCVSPMVNLMAIQIHCCRFHQAIDGIVQWIMKYLPSNLFQYYHIKEHIPYAN
jgi:hypothetical protein